MRISKRLKQKFSVGCPVEQKLLDETHESSSVGASPSSAAPVEQNPFILTELETAPLTHSVQ
jgi:hypothetical protein